MEWRWHNFKPEEVLSPVGMVQLAQGNLLIQPSALDLLQEFRNKVGVGLLCNHAGLKYRGYRSPYENRTIGGAKLSRHVQGIAFDLTPEQGSLIALYEAACEFSGFGAAFIYPNKHFVHVDCRPRWRGVQLKGMIK